MDKQKVIDRLSTLGYEVTEADDGLITYIGATVENTAKVILNLTELPAEVENIIIDKIVGEFLLNKKQTGQLTGLDLDAVTEISEGDTTVRMDKTSTPDQQMNSLIHWLIAGRDHVLLTYRSIRW